MAFIPRIYLNPYGARPYKTETSKSIFKDQTLFSNLINSINVNQLTNIFNDDLIITGLELISSTLTNNNRSMSFVLSKGKIIQNSTVIEILENVNISIDVFSEYDILETNMSESYFKISNDQTVNLPRGKSFGIFNSNEPLNNHLNWIVKSTQFDGVNTKVYTHQVMNNSDTSGKLVNDNFGGTSGEIILMSKYRFIETLNYNPIEFIPLYRLSNNIYPEFDSNEHRIIYDMFEIEKDNTNYKIINYNSCDYLSSVILKDSHYVIHNINDIHPSYFDGGVIN